MDASIILGLQLDTAKLIPILGSTTMAIGSVATPSLCIKCAMATSVQADCHRDNFSPCTG